MAALLETDTWEPEIYQLEMSDPVEGGPDGVSNRQPRQLAARTRYLKLAIEAVVSALLEKAPLASPELTGTPTAPTAAAGTNTTQIANTAFVKAAIADLVASSPAALDTLNELATALGNDANFATTITNALAGKQPLDATLTALSALTTAANKLIYSTGPDNFAQTDLTTFARTLLAAGDAAAARSTLGSLGDNQTWQDMTASRAASTTYTNATGRPIVISVTSYRGSGSGINRVQLSVGGQVVAQNFGMEATQDTAVTAYAVVPPGATYSAGVVTSLSKWMELRA